MIHYYFAVVVLQLMMRPVKTADFTDARPMTVPALGRPFLLGALYNQKQGELILGLCLWNRKEIQNKTFEKDLPNVHAKIVTSESLDAKSNLFHLKAEISADFANGKVKVHGAAEFLVHKPQSMYETAVSFVYEERTHLVEMTMDALNKLDYPDMLDKDTGATHVVTAIEYGATAVFRLHRKLKKDETKIDAYGELKIRIEGDWGHIDGEAKMNYSQLQNDTERETSCEYMGDVNLPKPPISYVDAVLAYQNMSRYINKTVAVPLRVHLTPLHMIDSKASRLIRQISNYLLKQVSERMQRYNDLEDSLADVRETSAYKYLPTFRDHVASFRTAISVHRAQFQKKLLYILPRIRGGGRTEEELVNALDESKVLFTMESMEHWIRYKLTEAGCLAEATSALPLAIVKIPGGFEKVIFNDTIKYVLVFSFYLYNNVDNFTECIKQACTREPTSEFCKNSNCNKPYESWTQKGDISEEMSGAYAKFKRAYEYNKNMSAVPSGKRTAAIIRGHAKEEGNDTRDFAVQLFVQGGCVKFKGAKKCAHVDLPAIENISRTRTNESGFMIKWNVHDCHVPNVQKKKYLVQHHFPGLSANWTNFTVKHTHAFIQSVCDVEVRIGIYCSFGICNDEFKVFRALNPEHITCNVSALAKTKEDEQKAKQRREQEKKMLFEATRVIVVSGQKSEKEPFEKSILMYRPKSGTTSSTPFIVNVGRHRHIAETLPSGKVLIADGEIEDCMIEARVSMINATNMSVLTPAIINKTSSVSLFKLNEDGDMEPAPTHEEEDVFKDIKNKASNITQKKRKPKLNPKRSVTKAKVKQTGNDDDWNPINTTGCERRTLLLDIDRNTIDPWTRNMETHRVDAASASLNDRIYVCGGFNFMNYSEKMDTCEVFSDGPWYPLPGKMLDARMSFALVSTDKNELYAIGGKTTEDIIINRVEKYSLKTHKWTKANSLKQGRHSFGGAFVFGVIYICGGQLDASSFPNEPSVLSSCESLNTTNENAEWKTSEPLKRARMAFSMLKLANDQLYVFYGYAMDKLEKERVYVREVETYNAGYKRWFIDGDLAVDRSYTPAVALPKRAE